MALTTSQAEWKPKAACRGPQAAVFFPPTTPERRDEKRFRETIAKRICEECCVRDECLDYAMKIREPHGIWGGLSETERRHLSNA